MRAMNSASGQTSLAALAQPFLPCGPAPAQRLWIDEGRPWTASLVDYYLRQYSAPGDLVVDPFATQPALARAATASQRRILLNHYSPATALTVSVGAEPPLPSALDAAYSATADALRRGRPLSHYLQSLYESICPECAQTLAATYFVWDRDTGEPVTKGYTCPHCGNNGEAPADLADSNLAASLEVRGAAYWGLLSRLVAPGDPQTAEARALLDLYTPRTLIVISELLAAIEQRLKDPAERRAGQALVLHVMQRCLAHAVTPDAGGASEAPLLPAHLSLPPRFVEHNAWLAFTNAYRLLRQRPSHPLRQSSDLASLLSSRGLGSALLLSLSLQDLARQLQADSVTLAISDPPRLTSSQYPLSYLWSSWLFGRKAVGHLKPMLAVQNTDWDWYARVMTAALRSVRRVLKPEGHLVLILSGTSARQPLALLYAASQAGLRLMAHATQAPLLPDDNEPTWQLVFGVRGPAPTVVTAATFDQRLRQAAQEAVHDLVHLRGEPAPAALAHTAIAVRWAEELLLGDTEASQEVGRRPVTALVQQSRLALTPELAPQDLRYVAGSADNPIAQWTVEDLSAQPLADRVELAVAELLAQGEHLVDALYDQIYARFPGWLTPDHALITACLDSYGVREADQMRLRAEDDPIARAQERRELLALLHDIGRRLGYQVAIAHSEREAAPDLLAAVERISLDDPAWWPASLVWRDAGRPVHAFALVFQALLAPWLKPPPAALDDCARCVVLPGSRAGLLAFKLRRTPAWRARLAESGWEFVKFRHLRRLAAVPDLTRASWRARLGLDPAVILPGAQLPLFEIPLQGANDAD